MRDKSKVVRTALRAAKRRRYDIGGIADPYGVIDPEEELRRKNPLYQNTGDLGLFNQQPYNPSKDQQTFGPNTNAGQLFAGIPGGLNPFGGTPTTPDLKSNDMVPYSNANYQPGAVQSASLAPPANTVDPFSAYITGALAGLPTTPSGQMPAFVSTPFTPDPVTPSQPATRGVTIADPTQVAALTPSTTPNQMFTDSGKIASRAGEALPGYLGPERSAFVDQSKGMMASYGNLADTFAANQAATPTSAEVNQSLPGAVTGQNLTGSFDPLASQDILGDVSHGVFGLSGPTGLSNAMQQTDEQVSEQEAQQEAEQAAAEQAAAEQAAAEQAAAEQAAEQPGGGQEESHGGGAPEGGGGPDEKRGGRIYRHKYATDGFVDDLLAKKQQDMDPRQYLLFGNTDTSLPPAGLPIGQAVGTKAVVDTAKGVLDASKLTQEALEGRLPPDYFHSDEGIRRALNAAGIGMVGGIAGVPARAGQTVLGSGPILKDIIKNLKNERGVESARRLERSADEIPNLEKLYTPRAISEAFTGILGDESLVMSMKPEDFRKFAAPYDNFNTKWLGKGMPKMTRDEYIKYLSSLPEKGGFSEVPYLQFGNIDNVPAIVGHEGRHRSDALVSREQPMSLVRLEPNSKLKNQLKSEIEEKNPYWRPYQDEKLKMKFLQSLPEDLRVVPQGQSLDELHKLGLPEPYKDGGKTYPLAKEGKDKLTYMKPKKFLAKARSLNMDKDDRTTIDEFKSAIKKGQSLDPLALYPHNRENGRHRAMAAKELGIKKVPVHNYRNEARGGSIVDKALMLTSRRLAAAKAPK